jgi:ferrous iron transport protein A
VFKCPKERVRQALQNFQEMKKPMETDTDKVIHSEKMKAVSDLPAGGRGVVRLLRGGEEFAHRMVALGFTPGVEVTVVQNYGRGPILVTVRDARVALGRGEALKVLVETL